MKVEDDAGGSNRWMLTIKSGTAECTPTRITEQVTLTRRQLAVWYAGGYRSATSARMAGVHATSEEALTTLVHSTTRHEPWLPDHF
ncbi:sterol carrier protein domain-containing protein [Streptomyces sp. HSW2009]|uniref:sterol carrier protein domain-containing protein n=1 Tax=Streptomyces sp. HSW2009 TaxID=3142890 RepID=UPI0032EE310A